LTRAPSCFSLSFFIMTVLSAYLFVWAAVWWGFAGNSNPTDRVYYRELLDVLPVGDLGIDASLIPVKSVPFYYDTRVSGWPTVNNVFRLMLGLLLLSCALLLTHGLWNVRKYISFIACFILSCIALVMSLVVLGLDSNQLAVTKGNCGRGVCDPELADLRCQCSTSYLFYVMLAVDAVFLLVSLIAAILMGLLLIMDPSVDVVTTSR